MVFDNTLSDALTVIEINGLDRPGLLYDVTRAISDLNLDIASAHVATFGEKAVDVFFVTNNAGYKLDAAETDVLVERLQVAAELEIDRRIITAALDLLEEEGLLVAQGPGRRRRIVLPEGQAPSTLRVAMLFSV